MSKIVTHIKPHLDDVCAAWLLKKYLPSWKSAEVEFVPVDSPEAAAGDDSKTVHIGIGRGRFDEHKGDVGECAASLVYAYVSGEVALEDEERQVLDRLVSWVKAEDTGRLLADAGRVLSVPAILESHFLVSGKDSMAVFRLGCTLLEALLVGMRNQVDLEADWRNRVEFDSAFGRAVALRSDARSLDSFAYAREFPLMVRQHKDGSYSEIRASVRSGINLLAVAEKLKPIDPEATWFFHHSGKLLLNGGDLTSRAKPTKLSLDGLIDLLKQAN